MQNRRVAAVMINYNSFSDTFESICSLKEMHTKPEIVIVIDNCSKDGSDERLIHHFNEDTTVLVLRQKRNLGFSGGNNVGIQYALARGYDDILIINNDTYADKYMLKKMIESRTSVYEAVCPLILNYYQKDIVWACGGYFDKWCVPRNSFSGDNINDVPKSLFYTEHTTGCCILVSKEIIKRVGSWDEEYFLYWEDVDYSVRMIRKECRILSVPTAVLYHKISSTTGIQSPISCYYGTRNRFMFIRNNGFPLKANIWAWISTLKNLIVVPKYLKKYIVKGIIDYLNNKSGIME